MDEVAIEMTRSIAKRSSCSKRQVGAVITKGGRIISSGYAGAPPGMPHCIDDGVGCLLDANGKCIRTIHAEQNAIAVAAKNGISLEGGVLFCTVQPCYSCAKLIIAGGIKKVIYTDEPMYLSLHVYPRSTLQRCGIYLMATKTDPGYTGELTFALSNLGNMPFRLELGARFANIVFLQVIGDIQRAYERQWKGGRVSTGGMEKQV